jgi:GNAT superfamily N-acetyltransferase
MGTAHTFVLADASTVLAYYSLTATSVSAADAPRSLAHGSPQTIPAWLIARLAVDRHVQGRGIGVATLIDAFGRLTIASLNGPAARLVVVDAIDHGAHKFYEKNGFRSVPESNRLFMKMSTTRQIATQG